MCFVELVCKNLNENDKLAPKSPVYIDSINCYEFKGEESGGRGVEI